MKGNICVTGLQGGPGMHCFKLKESEKYMGGYGKSFRRHLSSKPNYEENNFDVGSRARCLHG